MNYNEKYANNNLYWGAQPSRTVVDAAQYIAQNARILDLGCAEGRNSLYLSNPTRTICAIDLSPNGIDTLTKLAKEQQKDIHASVADVTTYLTTCDEFDAILAMNVLQFIPTAPAVVRAMQAKTTTRGIHVIEAFVANAQAENLRTSGRYTFSAGELKELYEGWNIYLYEEYLTPIETHGEKPHRHRMVRLIAQKE